MRRKSLLLGFFLLLLGCGLGFQLGIETERQHSLKMQKAFEQHFQLTGSGVTFKEDPEKEVDMGLFWTVWRMLDRHYVNPAALTIDELRFGAVKGLVEGVGDPYSAFMTPKESNDFQESLEGTLQGIGAELALRDGVIVVVAPLKGSPAQAAGLLPLDIITHVNGESIEGFSLNDAVQRIRGPKGTEVKITVFRPAISEVLELTIIREEIHVPSVEHEVLQTGSGSVGYVSLNQFGNDTTAETKEALEEFLKEPIEGLILDLRFNGGGYLEGAIEVASFFLKQGKIVSVHRRDTEVETHYAFGNPLIPDLPMVVLINQGSASASEIVAGALQDNHRALIMGETSFGKGTVQEVIDLPGGGSLRVTVATWHTPNGKDLSKEGVKPDRVIPLDMKEYAAGNDLQKEKAAEFLLDGSL
ncbi:MAG TPA: S41 family peptidase [Candidatus Peribacterales bacterium]|nr:S41 family peptidase [Candidatus Peribacterales bacterium]